MRDVRQDRRVALRRLMEQPDPPGMRRGHVRRLEGQTDRQFRYRDAPAVFLNVATVAWLNERGHA